MRFSTNLAGAFLIILSLIFTGYAGAQEPPKAEEKPKMEFKPKVGGYVEFWYRLDDSNLSHHTTPPKKTH